MAHNIVRFIPKGGIKKNPEEVEKFKIQIQQIDGSVVRVTDDYSYIDITIPEGNYTIVK